MSAVCHQGRRAQGWLLIRKPIVSATVFHVTNSSKGVGGLRAQCEVVAYKSDALLGCINRRIASRGGWTMHSLSSSE